MTIVPPSEWDSIDAYLEYLDDTYGPLSSMEAKHIGDLVDLVRHHDDALLDCQAEVVSHMVLLSLYKGRLRHLEETALELKAENERLRMAQVSTDFLIP